MRPVGGTGAARSSHLCSCPAATRVEILDTRHPCARRQRREPTNCRMLLILRSLFPIHPAGFAAAPAPDWRNWHPLPRHFRRKSLQVHVRGSRKCVESRHFTLVARNLLPVRDTTERTALFPTTPHGNPVRRCHGQTVGRH